MQKHNNNKNKTIFPIPITVISLREFKSYESLELFKILLRITKKDIILKFFQTISINNHNSQNKSKASFRRVGAQVS